MSRRDRLYAAALVAARTNAQDAEAAVLAYVDHIRKASPATRFLRRWATWTAPLFEWADDHPRIAIPLAAALLGAEIALLGQFGGTR